MIVFWVFLSELRIYDELTHLGILYWLIVLIIYQYDIQRCSTREHCDQAGHAMTSYQFRMTSSISRKHILKLLTMMNITKPVVWPYFANKIKHPILSRNQTINFELSKHYEYSYPGYITRVVFWTFFIR